MTTITTMETMNTILLSDIKTIIDIYHSTNIICIEELYNNTIFNKTILDVYEVLLSLPDYEYLRQTSDTTIFTTINSYISNNLMELAGIITASYSPSQCLYLETKIKHLETIPQPEQRTPQWYTFRNNRLTASDLNTVIDEYNKKNTKPNYKLSAKYKDLICKKCGIETPFIKGDAIQHGIKFESIATSIYETRNDLTILEFGCLPHQHIPFFGASPDGIASYTSNNKKYIGRMLEIKCPKSRPITGIIPPGYFAQMQGQLEVCDLEYCDYLECDFQFYKSQDDFFNDTCNSSNSSNSNSNELEQHQLTKMYGNKPFVKTLSGKEKGIILELYNTETKKHIYNYAPYSIISDRQLFIEWEQTIINSIFTENKTNIEYIGTIYWYLNKYNTILVKRNRDWFNSNFIKIQHFWNDVLKYRAEGTDTINTKKKYEYKHTNEMEFLN